MSEVGRNRFLNNLAQNSLGAHAVQMNVTPVVLDGNIYYGVEPVKVFWRDANGETVYTISNALELVEYQRATGQDLHSAVTEISFVDTASGDFRLVEDSAAVDSGQPLTRTIDAGTGTEVPVEDVSCFSAGLKTSSGEVLIPGDEIMIADSPARILAVDREASTLILDRPLNWEEADAVTYPYEGSGSDTGAMEMQ